MFWRRCRFSPRRQVVAILSLTILMAPSKAETPSKNPQPAAVSSKGVAQIAELPDVVAAIGWFRSHSEQLLQMQMELAQIPPPPFGEAERSKWLRERFRQLGLQNVQVDEIGNVLAVRPGLNPRAGYIALTAHIDTVFPAGTRVQIQRSGEQLHGPGVSDNAAGVTAVLAMAAAMNASHIQTQSPILFIGNVGEEGEGDLRGMRNLFSDPHWRDSIACTLVLDGAGADTVISEALGSKRFLVTVRGPGGHSWSDFGTPNPIMVLAHALEIFRRTPIPSNPKSTFNVGVISGGTSVNSIPESVSMRVDIRSVVTEQVDRLERALRQALDLAVSEESHRLDGNSRPVLTYDMKQIGSRPAARLSPNSHMLAALRAVDSFLGNKARTQRASTDANIPMSLGREAFAIGAGGTGGGAHTVHEWYDAKGRELGLKRILLTTLMLAEVKE